VKSHHLKNEVRGFSLVLVFTDGESPIPRDPLRRRNILIEEDEANISKHVANWTGKVKSLPVKGGGKIHDPFGNMMGVLTMGTEKVEEDFIPASSHINFREVVIKSLIWNKQWKPCKERRVGEGPQHVKERESCDNTLLSRREKGN